MTIIRTPLSDEIFENILQFMAGEENQQTIRVSEVKLMTSFMTEDFRGEFNTLRKEFRGGFKTLREEVNDLRYSMRDNGVESLKVREDITEIKTELQFIRKPYLMNEKSKDPNERWNNLLQEMSSKYGKPRDINK
jgi:hypothetical protein